MQEQVKKEHKKKGRKSREPKYIAFEYRDTIKTPARTEYILLQCDRGKCKRIPPVRRKLSKTGAHGEDYYRYSDFKKADVIARISVNNNGKHHCVLIDRRKDPKVLIPALLWLYKHEHICPHMIESINKPENYRSVIKRESREIY